MEVREFIKKMQNNVLLGEYSLQDMEWFMTEYAKHYHSEQLNLNLVGVTLPTEKEINIEGHKRHPVNLQDAGIAYSNRIQRNNFINGANWLRKEIEVKR